MVIACCRQANFAEGDRSSPSSKYWTKTGFGQDAGDLGALISLNLDSAFLDRAARAASFLHRLRELLLLRQADANEPRHDRHRLAAAMRRLSQNVDSAAVLLRCGNRRCRLAACLVGLIGWCCRQSLAAQSGERIVPKALAAIDGNAFLATHYDILVSKQCAMQIQAPVMVRLNGGRRRSAVPTENVTISTLRFCKCLRLWE
jgi:hypothetical protein